MEEVGAFFFGALVAALIIIYGILNMQPEIKREELYRFCLVKKIPLEECVIPKKPYGEEQAHEQ